MAYIETLAPRDWGFSTLFGYPYQEGVRNLSIALPCCNTNALYEPPSLWGRVKHLLVGVALLVPLVNTVVFVILRYFFCQPIFVDRIQPISSRCASSHQAQQIEDLNARRGPLVQELDSLANGLRETSLGLIRALAAEAATALVHRDTKEVETHFRLSKLGDPELSYWDGKISHAVNMRALPYFEVKKRAGVPATNFTQVQGLTQYDPKNFLCGYYALFFLLNAVQEQTHTDRVAFNEYAAKWHKLISTKRIAVWLFNHKEEAFPYGLVLPAHGLTADDMQYLIDHEECEELAPLRRTPGCLMLEMDEPTSPFDWIHPVSFLGQSKTEEIVPTQFPLYVIVKGLDMHYYLFYARTPGRFKVVHSLNYDITNSSCFDPKVFTRIILALTGTGTDLRLRW